MKSETTKVVQSVVDAYRGAEILPTDGPASIIAYNPGIVARSIVQGMEWLDLYDYLAEYGVAPHWDITTEELRIEVTLDIQSTGPALFCERMIPAGHANALFAEVD